MFKPQVWQTFYVQTEIEKHLPVIGLYYECVLKIKPDIQSA